MRKRTIVGVMSGTSADGIDVARCELNGDGGPGWGRLAAFESVPYDPGLRDRIIRLRQGGAATLKDLAQLTRDLTLAHADAVRKVMHDSVEAVADHGQTVFHAPPLTTQLLDPSLLSAEVSRPVIGDFRRADCAVGGQGAPLVPYADFRLFRDTRVTRVLLNLGGIANITYIPAGGGTASLRAFDTGPANCISDFLCGAGSAGRSAFDKNGMMAEMGAVSMEVVEAFMRTPYLLRGWPKSTDGPEMVAAFHDAGGMRLDMNDALATAAECVARSVARAVESLIPRASEVVVSGGGTRNPVMMRRLTAMLAPARVLTTDHFGVPAAAKEAIAFALLGHATLEGLPSNILSCTGAERPVVLGSITDVGGKPA